MTFFIILVIAAGALSVVRTVQAIVRDDRGPLRPPASHSVDPSFLPPASRLDRR